MEPKDTRITAVAGIRDPGGGEDPCVVQIYGPQLGKKVTLQAAEIAIGRGDGCEIVLDLDNVSRRHCTLVKRDLGFFLRDDDSTNGTYLNNAQVRGEMPLRSGDLVKVGSAIFKFLHGGELGSIEAQYHEEIYRLTIIDGLTQAYNKRYLLELLEREMARCTRHGRALSLVLIDIDHFKKINDGFGHIAGDHVLREMAATMKTCIRREDCLARYGGEEFVLVLPETGSENAVFLADKLRRLVEQHEFVFEGKRIPVTYSAGVASLQNAHDSAPAFLKVADHKLYEAKRRGRNQVVA
ncbi:MAG TPA: GGDEF domain-containing protein [Myxococcales bacterium]